MIRRTYGFTLVELLVAMSIFGVVLLLASNLFLTTNRYTSVTISGAELEEDVRLGLLRVNEVSQQAAYIYPNGVTLTLPKSTVITGKETLALLLAAGSTYCPMSKNTTTSYCLFVYRFQPRAEYISLLPKVKGATTDVLVEQRWDGLTWTQSTTSSGLTVPLDVSALAPTTGLLLDSADKAATDLSQLDVGLRPGMDTALQFGSSVANTNPAALIQALRPMLAAKVGTATRQRSTYIYVRSIPRAAPPGTGVSGS